ncbi:DUF5801 repeats-in-toxin domain-containing protein [Xenophilus sp. Marseille-Q4582]|uniref:DUF5801 repeats-in-toxin domain-containing protein n=1 Tax=Xenophilus sp. Marseille-Q4582 TaxID=2866600 RepID=UPI001CE408CB|nr:DUF5801 repeats-in-toxin domain-containing protein [Xenophilus sp. Marseille-Q4582]
MEVVHKAGGAAKDVNAETFVADRPSIIHLKIAPEKVARFERQGTDLVLVLKDGSTTTVRGFFAAYDDDGRNDLVLQDEAGVWWWGQYTAPWSEFHFTEIEWDDGVPVLWADSVPGWLIAGLGLLAVGAAAGGGGGGGGGAVLPPILPPAPQPPAPQPPAPQPPAPEPPAPPPPAPEPPAPPPPAPEPPAPPPPAPEPPAPPPPAPEPPAPPPPAPEPPAPPPPNKPPVAQEISDQTGTDAQSGIDVDVSRFFGDPDGDRLSFTAAGLPPGLSIHPQTGLITGTLDRSASQGGPEGDGRYTVTITASDGRGGTVSQTFTWTVGNPPPSANDEQTATLVNNPVSGNVLANDVDPDGDPLTVTTFSVPGVGEFNAGDTATVPGIGTIVIDSQGNYTFTPAAGYEGAVPPVTYTVSDGEGGTDTAQLDITVAALTIDPIVARNGADGSSAPIQALSGTGKPGAELVIKVDGEEIGRVTVDPDTGGWLYTWKPGDLPNGADQVMVETVINGTPVSMTRNVPVLTVTDGNGDDPGHLTVYESGLAAGSDPDADTEVSTGSLTLGLLDTLATVRIGAQDIGREALEESATTPVTVSTPNGVLTITGYDPSTGRLDFTYTLTRAVTHADANGNNPFTESLDIRVTDTSGDARIDTLNIVIVDDVPVAADPTAVSVVEGATTAVGSDNGGQNLLASGKSGADGAEVHDISYVDRDGVAHSNVEVPDGGLSVETLYGTLTVKQDGSWTYTPVAAAEHVKTHAGGTELSDDFSYRVIDADGDISTSAATQKITVTDTVPQIGTPEGASVSETHLPGGSDPAPGELQVSGSLSVTPGRDVFDTVFDASQAGPSGLTSGGIAVHYFLSSDGHTLTARKGDAETDPVVFTVQITAPATGGAGYTFTLVGSLDHLGGQATGASLPLDFGFTVTDSDGDRADGTFVVTVIDDAPVAADDTATVGQTIGSSVTGNVITGQAGTDSEGADTARVTQVSFGTNAPVTVPATGSIDIQGTYGKLTLHADGSYTYERTAGGIAGNASDEFTYTLTDADGDQDTATLTIETINADVSITGLTAKDEASGTGGDAVVNESKLPDGTGAGTAGVIGTGEFDVNAVYGVKTLSITQGAASYDIVTDGVVSSTLPSFTSALGNTLTITGYADGKVSYTYTLKDREAHADGGSRNALFEDFGIQLEDVPGNTASGTLSVRIVDDIPVIAGGTGNPLLVVDESDLDINASGSFAELFDVTLGADGGSVAYALGLNAGVASGLVDTATGEAVALGISAEGTLITGTAGGHTVFTIAIAPDTGAVTLDQQRAVRHPSGGASHDEPVSIAGNAIRIIATATDSDGDVVSSVVNIGNRFSFLDDGPRVSTSPTGTLPTALTVFDADTVTGTSTASAAFAGAFTQTSSHGADGAAAANPLVWTYALGLRGGSGAALDSGLSSLGSEITLYMVNGQVVGSTAASAATVNTANTVFAIAVNATGTVTLTQHQPIDHPSASHTETVSLLADLVTLTATVTVTDRDGDTASSSSRIDIGDKFVFTDTGPRIATPADAAVYEANFSNGSAPNPGALTKTGTLAADFGGDDGSQVTAKFTAATVAALGEMGLASNGTELVYVLSNNDSTLTATRGAGGAPIFTITLSPTGGAGGQGQYTFVLQGPLDHGMQALIDLPFSFQVTDADGDTADSHFNVTVHDDKPAGGGATDTLDVVEDSTAATAANTFNTSADANPANTVLIDGTGNALPGTPDGQGGISYAAANGTVTVNANGSITYVPHPNYSNAGGPDSFTYRTTNAGDVNTVTVTVNVKPVADAPTLPHGGTATDVDTATVPTQEDTPVALGLRQPVVSDATDQTLTQAGDYPERLGAITLTLAGAGAAAGAKLWTSVGGVDKELTPVGGKITIVLTAASGSEVPSDIHVTGDEILVPAKNEGEGVYYLTQAEYEAIRAEPAAHRHENFTVQVDVTSHEVDQAGQKLADVAGESSQQVLTVAVQAVTDDVELAFATGISSGNASVPGETYAASYADDKNATVTLREDSTFNLKDLLVASFADLDGSEVRSITIENTSGSAITVNGAVLAAGATLTTPIAAPGLSTSTTGFPDIRIGAPGDFSGRIDGIKVTLNAQDKDDDGFQGSPGSPANPANGVAEQDVGNNTVTLGLHVTPRAGDVAAGDVSTQEDTAVAFLQHVRVTDAGTGSEVIDAVSFEVPAGWAVQAPTAGVPATGWTVSGDGTSGTYTIIFDATLSEADRETVLDGFLITPPAHSSLDATVTVQVTTTDTQGPDGHTASVDLPITIAVTPVAEQVGIDSDGNGSGDVTMTAGHTYATTGLEDSWFELGTEGGFHLASGWSNEDGDEFTFAVLTPVLVPGSSAPGDEVIGAEFRYSTDGGETWVTQTYTDTGLWVPTQYLDTLQFKAPLNVAGSFEIQVQTATVDYDDGAGTTVRPTGPVTPVPGVVDVKISGSAKLDGITIEPVADDVTMSVTGKAKGLEDTAIPLSISATSSDPSETLTVVIKGIPAGATVHYGPGGSAVHTGPGDLTIPDFNGANAGPVSITPPANWSGTIPLVVEAQSVDGSAESAIYSRPITVQVVGVADDVVIVPHAPGTGTNVVVSEAAMDAGGRIDLVNLIASATTADADGSETLSYRVTGLPDGFLLEGATLISGGATGEGRVWSVSGAQLPNVKIAVPPNYSGVQTVKVQGISTERDGHSKTMPAVDLSFQVSPSVDGIANTGNSTLVEDVRSELQLDIDYQNGDTDETLGDIWIQADQASTPGYTLYLGGNPLTGPIENIDGVDYIRVSAADVSSLQVQGGAHRDGKLGEFNFLYEVIDGHYGSMATGPQDVVVKEGKYAITASAVTDEITLGLDIDERAGEVEVSGDVAEVLQPGAVVTVNLDVDSLDTDGSEHVVRVIVENVPVGVTVVDGEQISANTWVLVRSDAIDADGATIPVRFGVSIDAHGLDAHEITMKVQVKDRGDTAIYTLDDADRQEEAITWKLTTDFAEGPGFIAPAIAQWDYSGAHVAEDGVGGPYTLADLIDAEVSVHADSLGRTNTFTVSLTDVPTGTEINGMTLTNVDGVPTWTATLIVPPGQGANANTLLAQFLDAITITPPVDTNQNNTPGGFNFNATLSTSAGGITESETIPKTVMVVPVDPVTDAAVVTVVTADQDENPATGSSIPVTITVDTPADGSFGTIVDDVMYVTVNASGGNAGGTLVNTDPLAPQPTLVTSGPFAGAYAVPVTAGEAVSLAYTPPAGTHPGSVSFDVSVRTLEENAVDPTPVNGTGSGELEVHVANNGVADPGLPGPGSDLATGNEADSSDAGDAILIPGISTALVDSGERITATMLEGVPVGFLVYVNGALATNAGGDGTTNVWVLANGPVTAADEVKVLPPPYWSGTVTGMNLLVESGETVLSEKRVDTVQLGTLVVNPVADGLSINPTHSFGTEGQVIALRLNATMEDPTEATAAVPDGSTETTTVRLTGLGEHASFYVGAALIEAERITYDPAQGGTYTVAGLSQDDVGQLGFVQALGALTDQSSATAGLQIGVQAWTVESANSAASAPTELGFITLNLQNQQASAGNDTLLWTGQTIDGQAGQDTVVLRQGENLDGRTLALGLDNIEVLDLSIGGANAVTELRPEDVLSIVGTGGARTLTIQGNEEDSVQLASSDVGWSAWSAGSSSGGYTSYVSTQGGQTVTVRVADAVNDGPPSFAASSLSMTDLFGSTASAPLFKSLLPQGSTSALGGVDPAVHGDPFAAYAPPAPTALEDELLHATGSHY